MKLWSCRLAPTACRNPPGVELYSQKVSRIRVHGDNDSCSLTAPKPPVLAADWFRACPQRLPVRDPPIVRAQSHRLRPENGQDAQSFISYLFSYNQSVLFKKEEGGETAADQGKWIQLRERLYIIAPEGLAVREIIKETNGVGFPKGSSSPCIRQTRYNKTGGAISTSGPAFKCLPNSPSRSPSHLCCLQGINAEPIAGCQKQ